MGLYPRICYACLILFLLLSLSWRATTEEKGQTFVVEALGIHPSVPRAGEQVSFEVLIRHRGIHSAAVAVQGWVDEESLGLHQGHTTARNPVIRVVFNWSATPGEHNLKIKANGTEANKTFFVEAKKER